MSSYYYRSKVSDHYGGSKVTGQYNRSKVSSLQRSRKSLDKKIVELKEDVTWPTRTQFCY